MKKQLFKAVKVKPLIWCLIISTILTSSLLIYQTPLASAELQVTPLSNCSFTANDVDSKGVLWAGDRNFGVWKSVDSGGSFQLIYKLPGAVEAGNPFGGLVWTLFIDSRDYIFVSAGGTGGLFRSTDGGASFTMVLKTNGTTTESFYAAMTEDNAGSLYAVTYTSGKAAPYLLKSADGGTNWVKVGNFGVFHFHNIKFNPYNQFLYLIVGEGNTPDAARILRSKDGGASWSLVVKRNDNVGTVYLAMAFSGNYVYIGQDYPDRVCNIQRFYDDGSNNQFDTQTVYTPPSDGYMPFITATNIGDSLVFANCAENAKGVSRVVASADGVNWAVLKSQAITVADHRWNFLTTHPRSGFVFGTIRLGEAYRINYLAPPPTPSPQIEQPIIHATPKPSKIVATPTPRATATSAPTPTPTETPQSTTVTSPTPASTLTQRSTFSIDQYLTVIIVASILAVMGSVIVTMVLLKRRQNNGK
ncbi:MAG: WD40/YVTN/BNR-like repeat-containing protein [Candidatus Bathyarchaeia archaeon]|jgi:photosystem II stability/assembly factor-like uncharacterized protein